MVNEQLRGSRLFSSKGLLPGTGAEPGCLTEQVEQERITLNVLNYCRECCFVGFYFLIFQFLFL